MQQFFSSFICLLNIRMEKSLQFVVGLNGMDYKKILEDSMPVTFDNVGRFCG